MWIKKSIAEIPTTKHPLEVVEDLITTGSITDISLEIDDIGTENEYVKIMFKNKKRKIILKWHASIVLAYIIHSVHRSVCCHQ